MKRLTKTLILSIIAIWCIAQTKGTILVFSNQPAELLVDGEKTTDIEKDIPKKLTIEVGDHYIQAVNKDLDLNKGEMVTIKKGSNSPLKIEFDDKNSEPQETIPVADINFLAPGITTLASTGKQNNQYYYAFAEGDDVYISVSMTNLKGTNTIKIYSYPDYSVRYENLSFQELKDFDFKVPQTGIYIFEIASNHIFDRNCHFSLSRKPATEETKNFNTKVTVETRYKAVEVLKPTESFINSRSNFGGKTRIAMPITLPKGTEKWYYSVYAYRDKAAVANQMKTYSLFDDLTGLLGSSGQVISFGVNQLTKPPGSDYVDVYLIGQNNYSNYLGKSPFNHYTAGTRENVKSAVVDLNCCYQENIYLGLRNNDLSYGVDVVVEAVALIPETVLVINE